MTLHQETSTAHMQKDMSNAVQKVPEFSNYYNTNHPLYAAQSMLHENTAQPSTIVCETPSQSNCMDRKSVRELESHNVNNVSGTLLLLQDCLDMALKGECDKRPGATHFSYAVSVPNPPF